MSLNYFLHLIVSDSSEIFEKIEETLKLKERAERHQNSSEC